MTSSIAGRIPGGSSLPYSVTKAAQLHLMRCLASTQGPKIRVNAVLPGWLATEWGVQYSEERVREMNEKAYLKKEVSFFCSSRYTDLPDFVVADTIMLGDIWPCMGNMGLTRSACLDRSWRLRSSISGYREEYFHDRTEDSNR